MASLSVSARSEAWLWLSAEDSGAVRFTEANVSAWQIARRLKHHCQYSCCCWWSFLYSAFRRSRADSLRSHVILYEWIALPRFWISTEVVYLQRWPGWCYMKLLPPRRVLCTSYTHTPCHFMQSHIHKVHACLVVTGHLNFWQKDRDLLRATAVTRWWNGYRNKIQHRKLTPEKKNPPPPPRPPIPRPVSTLSLFRPDICCC